MKYEHIIHAITDEPWAIIPSKLEAICELINLKLAGVQINPYEAAVRREERRQQNIAVLPVYGVLGYRLNLVTQASGGTSLQMLGRDLIGLVNDPEIDAIVLEVDSPGGSVAGLEETADLIAAASRKKPIIAHANATAASAAYFLASQATEFWVTPSGQVGSIGVIAAHKDTSGTEEKLGIKTTLIYAGKYKAEGHDSQPLTDPAREYMQERVDQYYDTFVKAVARGRQVSEKEVRSGFGEGRVVGAKDAMRLGMVDGVGTFDHVIGRLARGEVGKRQVRAEVTDKMAAELAEARLHWFKEQYE